MIKDDFKYDAGKIQAGVLLDFKNALMEVAKVGTFGAGKYARNSWRQVENASQRYTDALWRHLLAPDELDQESGLPHLAHLAWNILAILEFKLCEDAKTHPPVREIDKEGDRDKWVAELPLTWSDWFSREWP